MAIREKLSKRLIIHAIIIFSCILSLYPILRVMTISLRPGDRAFSDSLSVVPENPTLEAYKEILFRKGYKGGEARKEHSLLRRIKTQKIYENAVDGKIAKSTIEENIEKFNTKQNYHEKELEKMEIKYRKIKDENSELESKIKANEEKIREYKLAKKNKAGIIKKKEKVETIAAKENSKHKKLNTEKDELQEKLSRMSGQITSSQELMKIEKDLNNLRTEISNISNEMKKIKNKRGYFQKETKNYEEILRLKEHKSIGDIEKEISILKNKNLNLKDNIVYNIRDMKKLGQRIVTEVERKNLYEDEYLAWKYALDGILRYEDVQEKLEQGEEVSDPIIEDGIINLKGNELLREKYEEYKNLNIADVDEAMLELSEKQSKNWYKFLNSSFWLWMVNSVVVAFFTVFLGVVFSLTAGYAFSRYNFWGKKFGLTFFLVTQMFPPVMLLLPMYLVMSRISIGDISWLVNILNALRIDHEKFEVFSKLITIYITTALPVCVWQMKGYYDTIPYSLEEAALIDGCSPFQAFYKIILPLVKPGIVVTALFSFMAAWTDFVVANVMVQSEKYKTLPLGLQSMNGRFKVEWANFSASSILVMIPAVILFMYLSKFLVSGLTMGGVKE